MKVDIIDLVSIKFGERRRTEYGDIEELAKSIKSDGLIQPIAVAELDPIEGQHKFLLVAGGRRYKALQLLKELSVPVRIYPPFEDIRELRTLELAENFHRQDLSWEEQVALKREIHEAQIAIYGPKVSTSPDAEGWTNESTADLLGVSKQSVQKDIQLAKAVEAAPEFFEGCKNKSEAAKVLKKIGESMIQAEMVKRAKTIVKSSDETSLVESYILKDCFLGFQSIPDKSISLCEIDPPYGIDLKLAKRDKTEILDNYTDVDADMYEQFLTGVLTESYRCMKDHSWLVFWFAPEPYFEVVYNAIIDAGFTTNRMCGIWAKSTGQSKRPESNLGNAYEMCFIAKKGSPALNKPGSTNLFTFPTVAHQKKIHPTERPIELIEHMLNIFLPAGSTILSPFLGSGTTILAAHNLNMTASGFDISKEYKDRFILRVHKLGEV